MRKIAGIIATLLVVLHASAQTPLRPVLSAYSVEAGSAHLADTYLAPIHYSGWNTAFSYERMQAMKFNPRDWVMQLDASVNLDHTENGVRNSTMWNLDFRVGWGMMRRWQPFAGLPALTLAIGQETSLRAGALYLSSNGNNPVAAKGAWTVGALGMASYSLKIGRLPVTFRYEGRMPVTGAFFSPEYGELYFEIWMGNRSNLVHPAWFGNYFALNNFVSADLRLGGTTLRLGYRNDILSTKVSGIVSRAVTHAFTFGIVTEWLSLNSRRKAPDADAQTISALYQ